MARFVIRPEIEGATEDDCEKLCARFYKRKIYTVIPNLEGIYYDLPQGTYVSDYYSNQATFFEIVRNTVLAITTQYDPPKKYELIVFEYEASRFVLNETTDKIKLPR